MLGGFLGEVGHLLFYDAGVDAVVVRRQSALGDVLDHGGVEERQSVGGSGAKQRSCFAQDAEGMDEAQSSRIDVRRQRRFMHEVPNGIVGQQDAVEFPQHSARCAAAKMHQAIEFMGLEFIIPDFDLPALVIKHHELRGRVCVRVEQGRHQPVTLPMTGPVGIVEGVFDDSNDEAMGLAASIAPRRIDGGQEGAVAERTYKREDHMIGHAAHDVYVAALCLNQRRIAVKPAIPEHQRVRRDYPQQRTGHREFALLASFDEGLHDDVRAGLREERHVNLRISALDGFAVSSGHRSSEGSCVGRRVGDIEGHAVDRHQAHPLVESAARAIDGDRRRGSNEELAHAAGTQTSAGLGQGRLTGQRSRRHHQQQRTQRPGDLSEDGRDVQVGPDSNGNHQPYDGRGRQPTNPLTVPTGLSQNGTNGL